MKSLCCIAAVAAALFSASAMAQQVTITGMGAANIWSSAQGTTNSYGAANGFGNSSSGSTAMATPMDMSGLNSLSSALSSTAANMMQAVTVSNAGTSSNGRGYAQAQTSGYAGGSMTAYRAH
jgi:hypothetical protein